MNYQDAIKKHLADFKHHNLDVSEPGIFRHKGRQYEYDHILPIEDRDKNLFEEAQPTAKLFFADKRNKRHKYFHHLNSSQAFAINLFFPYFYGGSEAATMLLRALGQPGTFAECVPEAVPDPVEESNIDMLWKTTDGVVTFCEVKLTEADFGKAKNDNRHRDKLHKHYADVLRRHLEPSRLEPLAFLLRTSSIAICGTWFAMTVPMLSATVW